jgi:hypothetical protein
MSGPPSNNVLGALCRLVVIIELFLGFLTLGLLGANQVYGSVFFEVTLQLLLGFTPILLACVATRNPKIASRLALWLALPFAILATVRLHLCSFYFPVRLIFATLIVLLPGLFWLVAARRNWPLPLQTELFRPRPFLAASLVISLLFFLFLASVAVSFLLPWWSPVGDCSGRPLLDENGKPRALDFTATILFVGLKSFHGYSLSSLARVDERFSDSLWVIPRYVILRGSFHSSDRGESFFVEGRRSLGPFTRFLPVIEPLDCGHSYRINDSGGIVARRILRNLPPRNGVRVIGFIFTNWLNPKPVRGLEVLVKGPTGTNTVVTDERGVYDVVGLPSGQYTVELPTKGVQPICALDLAKRAVGDCSFSLDEVHGPAD